MLAENRFIETLKIVEKEGLHLSYSWGRLFSQVISENWVSELEHRPDIAEQLEAFVSRYGRMQDTMADKLMPRWLTAQSEKTGSQIEILNRSEYLGVLTSVERWLEARQLRNRLVHECMTSATNFGVDLLLAKDYSLLLIETYNLIHVFATERMGIENSDLPAMLEKPSIEPNKEKG